jgi:hypothetical protein
MASGTVSGNRSATASVMASETQLAMASGTVSGNKSEMASVMELEIQLVTVSGPRSFASTSCTAGALRSES